MTKPIDLSETFAALSDRAERSAGRLAEILSLLTAIDHGELLSAVPADFEARARHAAGVCLLAILRRELEGFAAELDAPGFA